MLAVSRFRLAVLLSTFLLVGPSGIGKTTVGRLCAAALEACQFVDLDDAVASRRGTATAYNAVLKHGWEPFFQDCQDILTELVDASACSDEVLVVAVGEGALWRGDPRMWLSNYDTIALVASPREVYDRRDGQHEMSFDEYCRYSYSRELENVYRSCSAVIDCTGMVVEQVVENVMQVIRGMQAGA